MGCQVRRLELRLECGSASDELSEANVACGGSPKMYASACDRSTISVQASAWLQINLLIFVNKGKGNLVKPHGETPMPNCVTASLRIAHLSAASTTKPYEHLSRHSRW